jgi:hypothetical protein
VYQLRGTHIEQDHVKSSNLCYLESVHKVLLQSRNVVAVMKKFSVKDTPIHYSGRTMAATVKVDVVAESGLVWIRVNARNAKGLRHEIAGLEEDSDFDSDNDMVDDSTENLAIFRKARALMASADRHLVHFRKPMVVYAFMRITPGEDQYVDEQIIDKLSNLGITVYTKSEFCSTNTTLPGRPCTISPLAITEKLNLDVSTVLALISELVHRRGVTPSMVHGDALQLQATQELSQPILPVLATLLDKKQLFVTKSALDKLNSIVSIVGGEKEKARFDYMLGKTNSSSYDLWLNYDADPSYLRLTVMEDKPTERFLRLLDPPDSLEQRTSRLNNGRKIRSKFNTFHVNVFGTGDANKMTTVTSIAWMRRALADAGLAGVAIVEHEPRSLAEQKIM